MLYFNLVLGIVSVQDKIIIIYLSCTDTIFLNQSKVTGIAFVLIDIEFA